MDPAARKIHLVRHGESEWNSERRVQGNSCGVVLSDRGRLQSRLLGKRLRSVPFDSVYCSDIDRAVETARIALGDSCPIVFDHGLREISFGEWEGRLVSELSAENPGALDGWFRKPSAVDIPGAERYEDFHRRIVGVMDRMIGSSTGDLLVICHGGVICTWLTHILGMDPDDFWAFSLPNTSITTVVLEFRPRLRLLGDASHLDPESLGFDGMPATPR